MERKLDRELVTVTDYRGCTVAYSFVLYKGKEEKTDVKVMIGDQVVKIKATYRCDEKDYYSMDIDLIDGDKSIDLWKGVKPLSIEGWTLNDTRMLIRTVLEVTLPQKPKEHSFYLGKESEDVYPMESIRPSDAFEVFTRVASVCNGHDIEVKYEFDEEECCEILLYRSGVSKPLQFDFRWLRSYNAFPVIVLISDEDPSDELIKAAMPVYGERFIQIHRTELSSIAERV